MSEGGRAGTMHEGGRVRGIQVKGEKSRERLLFLSPLPSQSPSVWWGQTSRHLNVLCYFMIVMEYLCLEKTNKISKKFFGGIPF